MTLIQQLITVALCVIATALTRFSPFVIFSGERQLPAFVRYLGRALPPAVFGMLVVYSLKGVSVLTNPYGIPELIALAAVVALHLWRRNMLLSIAGGTVLYMLLVQLVF